MIVYLMIFSLVLIAVIAYFVQDGDSDVEFVGAGKDDYSMIDDPFAFQRAHGPQVFDIGPRMIEFD